MRFLTATILTMIASYAMGLYLPWWSVAIAGFIVSFFIFQKSGYAFMSGFFGLLLLWGILAWSVSAGNDHILGTRVAILVIQSENAVVLILLSACIGALTAGMGALSGSLLRSIIKPDR